VLIETILQRVFIYIDGTLFSSYDYRKTGDGVDVSSPDICFLGNRSGAGSTPLGGYINKFVIWKDTTLSYSNNSLL